MYDPDGWMRATLKEMRNYVLPNSKELPHEDLIPKIVAEGEAADKFSKLNDVLRVEKELKRIDPQFVGFYMDIPYPQRIRKMVADHAEIMTKLPKGSMGEEHRVCPNRPEPDVSLDEEEEDDAPQASWMAKRNKRQKIIPIPPQIKQRTLQILQGDNPYFADIRQTYLQAKVTTLERTLTDLELPVA